MFMLNVTTKISRLSSQTDDLNNFFSRDSTQSREEALSVLRSSGEFVRYAVSVAVQKIQQLEETGHTDGPDGQNAEKTFTFLCDTTRWGFLSVLNVLLNLLSGVLMCDSGTD